MPFRITVFHPKTTKRDKFRHLAVLKHWRGARSLSKMTHSLSILKECGRMVRCAFLLVFKCTVMTVF